MLKTKDQSNPVEKIFQTLSRIQEPELFNRIVRQLQEKSKQKTGRVFYAGELSDNQRMQLETNVKQKFPLIRELEFIPSPHLIAGLKIVMGDYVYEKSIQQKLQDFLNR